METTTQRPKLLVITGPTASGKSSLAIKIAKEFGGEIICADSLTVRGHVNIGSAKPTKKERMAVPHHLLDVAELCEDFTAANFKRLAVKAIADIQKRGKLPILVGGTGLYIDAVLFDFEFLPPGDRLQREKLNQLSLAELMGSIEKQGISTEGIDTRNKRRLIRLLETDGVRPVRGPMRPDTLTVGVNPPGEVLKERINKRVHRMVEAGLEDEVKKLAQTYGWDCEALKAIGYSQWQAYFDGAQTLDETVNKIISSTNGLAKRQRTWFKNNQHINWFSTPAQAQKFIKNRLLNT
jgi:tRNA dimethylallyltransferase